MAKAVAQRSRGRSTALLRSHPTAAAAILIFLLAISVRLGYWLEVRGTALDRWHEWDQTDMATYLAQARQLPEDWLASEPYHPYHGWQKRWPPEKWIEWYGPHVFHQAPAYSYLLALFGLLLRDPLPWIKILQIVIGAGTCVLVLRIASRLAGLMAGCAAGIAAALYGPLLYLEPQLLREGPALFGVLAVLLLLLRAVERDPESGRQTWISSLVLGGSLGVLAMFHEMAAIVGTVTVIALAVHHGRSAVSRAALALAALVLGWAVGFAPLLARNLAVGAPPLSVSCRARIDFVEANEAGAARGGAAFSEPGESVGAILDASGGSVLGILAGVWTSYRGDLGLILRHWSTRCAAIWQRPESADNTSYYLYRNLTRTLAALPTFALLFPLGLAGAVVVLAGRMGWVAWPSGALQALWVRSVSDHRVLALYVFAVAGALSLVHTVARFRLFVVPVFWIYAGVLVAWLVASLRARRSTAVAIGIGAVLVGLGLQQLVPRGLTYTAPRPSDYVMASALSLRAGDYPFAVRVAEDALRHDPGNGAYFANLAGRHERDGHRELAIEYYRRALRIEPELRAAEQGLARLTGRGGSDR